MNRDAYSTAYSPDCPVCGHTGHKQVTSRQAEFSTRPHSVTVFKCASCRTVFTDRAKIEPTPAALASA
jgi:hypothetical protein